MRRAIGTLLLTTLLSACSGVETQPTPSPTAPPAPIEALPTASAPPADAAASTTEPADPPTVEATAPAEATPAPVLFNGIPQGITDDGFPYLGDPNAPVTLIDYSDFL